MVQGKDEAPRRFSGMLTLNALRKPPPAASNGPKRAKRRPQRSALSQRLLRDFPTAFKYPPVPLAIGIGLKLRDVLGAEFKPGEIRGFLQAWTSGPRYLKAIARGEMRHDLDGSPAGLPAPEHRADALKRLNAMRRSVN